jgi:hypothetical protein
LCTIVAIISFLAVTAGYITHMFVIEPGQHVMSFLPKWETGQPDFGSKLADKVKKLSGHVC